MATKRFVYVKKAETLTSALQTTYANSIVFIEDTKQIFTHGKFFGVSASDWANLKYFSKVAGDTGSASAAAANSTLNIKGTNHISTSVGADGVTITDTITLTSGDTDGHVSFCGNQVAVTGLKSAAYTTSDSYIAASKLTTINTDIDAAKSAANAAMAEAKAKVASVGSGSAGIKIGGTATDPTVGLLINSGTGNVTLTETAKKGLSANINLPVTGVASGDKILSLSGTNLSATVGIEYNKDTKVINLTGKGHTASNPVILGTISAIDFVKDGMLDSAKLVYRDTNGKEVTVPTKGYTPYLVLTFNTDAGKSEIPVDMTNLVDVYNGANLYLSSVSIPASYTAPANNDSVDTAISKLAAGVAKATASGVTSFGGKTGAITINGGTGGIGVVNFLMNGNKLTATVSGVASSTQGSKADNALQSVNASSTTATYISASTSAKTNNTQTISVGAKTLVLDSASSTADGLATAYDTKNYIDKQWEWEEL